MKPTFNQLVAAAISFGTLLLLGLVYFIPGKGSNQGMIIGALISTFTSGFSYFVGTTSGSKDKDNTIKQMLNQKNEKDQIGDKSSEI